MRNTRPSTAEAVRCSSVPASPELVAPLSALDHAHEELDALRARVVAELRRRRTPAPRPAVSSEPPPVSR